MTKSSILIVDDNAEMRVAVCETLEADGYMVFQAANAAEALSILKIQKVEAILLDLMLPDANGLDLLPMLRVHTDASVIVVSGKGSLVDRVVGLEMGADDYLGKPFEMKELSARIKANIRRHVVWEDKSKSQGMSKKIRFGNWILDCAKFQIFDEKGKSGDLTVMEFRLLEALVISPNCVLSREQLLDKARVNSLEVFDRAVDIQVARIRKKIRDDPKCPQIIKTVRGAGYMLACETEIVV